MVVVTHNRSLAARADRVLLLEGGVSAKPLWAMQSYSSEEERARVARCWAKRVIGLGEWEWSAMFARKATL